MLPVGALELGTARNRGPPRDEGGFARLHDRAQVKLTGAVRAVVADVRAHGCPTWLATCRPSRAGWTSCPATQTATGTGMHRVEAVTQAYRQLRDPGGDGPELQVSYFAQELRTPYPASDQRIYQAMNELTG